jgi:Asp/Glu/hydantoin racemase
VLVHTVPPLVDAFTGWCAELLPDTRLFHVLDEPVLERIRARGHRAPEDDERLAEHLAMAEAVGADAVLVTCSTVSLGVEAVRAACSIPVVAIDEAMVGEAVRLGPRIGLVATNVTTIEPSTTLLQQAARAAGLKVGVRPRLVDGALPALLRGETAVHDRLVADAVRAAALDADVVVLAQASMARVLAAMGDQPAPVPVLASPFLALREVARLLAALGPANDTLPQRTGEPS